MEYQKINTVFMRDVNNIIMPKSFTVPEFEEFYNLGMKFEATEKIDGTNIRIEVDFYLDDSQKMQAKMEFRGRTDRAQIPGNLNARLHEIFDNVIWTDIFPDAEPDMHVTVFGEGYGKKIQKGGGRYLANSNDFILFDVRVGEWWLLKDDAKAIAEALNVQYVPDLGLMTIAEAIDYVKSGFVSNIAEDKTYIAEGLVLRHPRGLKFRNGQRIIFKIKNCDFEKFASKYGADYDGPQEPNTHYSAE